MWEHLGILLPGHGAVGGMKPEEKAGHVVPRTEAQAQLGKLPALMTPLSWHLSCGSRALPARASLIWPGSLSQGGMCGTKKQSQGKDSEPVGGRREAGAWGWGPRGGRWAEARGKTPGGLGASGTGGGSEPLAPGFAPTAGVGQQDHGAH